MSKRHGMELSQVLLAGMRFRPSLTAAFFAILYGDDDPKWTADDDVAPDLAEAAEADFREAGSHDLANFFGDSKTYKDIAVDVAAKLDVKIKSSDPVEEIERKILEYTFTELWDKMSTREREELASQISPEAGIDPGTAAKLSLLGSQVVLKQLGGFAVYRIGIVVANSLSRALLGRGLTFAANAALTRTIGTMIGPIGWIATGIWTLHDLMGPASRKTVPGVCMIGALRALLISNFAIGVVGDASAGKDSMLGACFKIDTKNVSPVAGSTKEAERFVVGKSSIEAINFPGFNDYRSEVDAQARELMGLCRAFIVVLDASRGITKTDVQILEKVRAEERPFVLCMNKEDLIRNASDKVKIEAAARSRLKLAKDWPIVWTSFDPLPGRTTSEGGCYRVLDELLKILPDEVDPRAISDLRNRCKGKS